MDFFIQPKKATQLHKIRPTRGLRVYRLTTSVPTDPRFDEFSRYLREVEVGSILEVHTVVEDNRYGGTVIYLVTIGRPWTIIQIPPSFFTTENFKEVDAADGPLFLAPDLKGAM